VDFFEDDKIQLIEAEFGTKGVCVAIRLLCKVYKNGYFYQWGGDECLLLSKQIGDGIVPNLVEEIVKGLVRRSFFDKGVFDSFRILTSRGIQRRYIEATGRTRAGVKINPDIDLIHSSSLLKHGFPQGTGSLPQENSTEAAKRKKSVVAENPKIDPAFILPQGNKGFPQGNGSLPQVYAINKIKEKENKTTPPIIPPNGDDGGGAAGARDFFKEISEDEKYLTDTACVTGMTIDGLRAMIPLFRTQCEATETRHGNLRDVKRHFLNYVNKKKQINEQSSSYGTKETDRSNATKRVCHRPEEYGEEI
jgi:hypothetical protein